MRFPALIIGAIMAASAANVEARVKATALADLFVFAREVLGYTRFSEPQREICARLQTAERDVLVLEPRGHMKTSSAIAYVVWRIVRDPDIKVLYNHKILRRSKEVLSEVKGHFERNKVLRRLFGAWQGEPWGQDAITVCRRRTPRKEPTLVVGAVEHEATGGHFNLVVNDDLAGLRDMVSEAARAETLRFYKSARYLRDEGGCLEVNLATRWHPEDVSGWILLKRAGAVDVLLRKARRPDGSPFFPELFSDAKLRELEQEDPTLYAAQMDNDPRAMGAGTLFPIEKLRMYEPAALARGDRVGYVDPAFGKRERGEPCFFVLCVLQMAGPDAYVVDWPANRDQPEQNEQMLVQKIREHGLRRLGVESNAAQSEFVRSLQKTVDKAGIPLAVEPINHSANKDRRIEGMHGTVVRSVLFRRDWDEAYPESMRQLVTYPSKFKDAPDALEAALAMASGGSPVVTEDFSGDADMRESQTDFYYTERRRRR